MGNNARRVLLEKHPQLREHIKIFSDSLRTFRRAQGYSQREFSVRLGMNASTVGQLETGVLLPSIELMLLIVDVLGVTPNELFGYPNWAYDNEIKRRFNENHIEDRFGADTEGVCLNVGG